MESFEDFIQEDSNDDPWPVYSGEQTRASPGPHGPLVWADTEKFMNKCYATN